MPFVYAPTPEEEDEWNGDPPLPRADEFVYIPTPKWSRVSESVRFSIEPPAPEPDPGEPLQAVDDAPPAPPAAPPRRSFWDVLLGRRRAPSAPLLRLQVSFERHRQRERENERRRQQLFSMAIPELLKAGVRRAYCRYDGGNDEGFSWAESFEMQDGARLDHDELRDRLPGTELLEKLYEAKVMFRQAVKETNAAVLGLLCHEWASMLLGKGFGTGEYSMYGAFTVDLEAWTITDDPDAAPVVENIKIAT